MALRDGERLTSLSIGVDVDPCLGRGLGRTSPNAGDSCDRPFTEEPEKERERERPEYVSPERSPEIRLLKGGFFFPRGGLEKSSWGCATGSTTWEDHPFSLRAACEDRR